MHARARWIALLLASLSLALPACGGAGGQADAVPSAGTTPPDPAPTPPDPTPTQASQLDRDLQARLDQLGIHSVTAPPVAPPALVALGRALFFDKILSGNRNMACATCHQPTLGTGDALSLPIGEGGTGIGRARQVAGGEIIPRNAPPLFNKGLPSFRRMFRDSRVSLSGGPGTGRPAALQTPEPALDGPDPQAADIATLLDTALAAQAVFPLTSEAEMLGHPGENELADAQGDLQIWSRVMARLVGTHNGTVGGIPAYRALFQAAYPDVVDFDQLNIGHVGRALAAFEDASFRALQSPFDAWLAGDLGAMTDQAKRGALLFHTRAGCFRCHGGPLQTDNQHHAIAIPQLGPGIEADGDDLGRFDQTGNPDDRYAFRTPSLRNTELTGPWMHDGAFTTLAAAVRHYVDPVGDLRTYDATQLSPLLQPLVDGDPQRVQARADALDGRLRPPPRLDAGDVDDLLAFLHALTDPASLDLSGVAPASVPSGLPVGG